MEMIVPVRRGRLTRRSRIAVGGAVVLALAILFVPFLAAKWPFTAEKVTAVIQNHFGRSVKIGRFHQTFFPPGFVAEDLRLGDTDLKGNPPLAVARKVVLSASYHGLLDHRVARVDIAGLEIAIPPNGGTPIKLPPAYNRPAIFDFITVTDGSLTVLSGNPAAVPFKTKIKSLQLSGVSPAKPIAFHASLLNETPPSEIQTAGTLGPWDLAQPRRTPISGSYRVEQADLSVWKDVSGMLSSTGKFEGTLARLHAEGSAEIAEFHVARSRHKARLSASFRAVIDEENGNIAVEHVEASLGHTTVVSNGEIAGVKGQRGKTLRLHLSAPNGTVDDLLRTATEQQTPSLTGSIALTANLEMPPGPGFLRRVHLTGDFGIGRSRLTNSKRQAVIDHLGKSFQGESKTDQNEDLHNVLAALRGHVAIRDGIATLTHVSFRFEGSDATASGTYNLLDKSVNLDGILKTKGKIADTTTGWKAGLLTVISPLMRKNKTTTVQFSITGTSAQPKFSFRLGHKPRA